MFIYVLRISSLRSCYESPYPPPVHILKSVWLYSIAYTMFNGSVSGDHENTYVNWKKKKNTTKKNYYGSSLHCGKGLVGWRKGETWAPRSLHRGYKCEWEKKYIRMTFSTVLKTYFRNYLLHLILVNYAKIVERVRCSAFGAKFCNKKVREKFATKPNLNKHASYKLYQYFFLPFMRQELTANSPCNGDEANFLSNMFRVCVFLFHIALTY